VEKATKPKIELEGDSDWEDFKLIDTKETVNEYYKSNGEKTADGEATRLPENIVNEAVIWRLK